MLEEISSYVMRCADVMSRISGIDVEVVDMNLRRIAGTGAYSDQVGENISTASQIYRKVLETGEPVYLTNPQADPICRGCPAMDKCQEKLNLSAPIKVDGQVVGILGMVCFTTEDRQKILENFPNYSYFAEQIANLIASRLRALRRTRQANQFTKVMTNILELSNQGVIVFNNLGQPHFINNRGRNDLGLAGTDTLQGMSVHSTGDNLGDFDEFIIELKGKKKIIVGQRHIMDPVDPDFASVLVFTALTRFKDNISSMANASTSFAPSMSFIVGDSAAMLNLKGRIKKVAKSTSTVLITGESGTGKELVARAIHAESDRHDKPFIAINCGAIPETLLESELFGYTKGAFSGANPKGHMGKFELANYGVLFLDEIGSMPIYLQVKLLRVLQERKLCRLGSNTLIDIHVRIIAATNSVLQDSIKQKTFREDLFYRLNVIPIDLPPLRDRIDDLEALVNHFLIKYATLFNKKLSAVSHQVLNVLKGYPWPGNVRELENTIEFAVNMMPEDGFLQVEHLPAKITQNKNQSPLIACATTEGADFIKPLSAIEKQAIQKALAVFGNDTKGKNKAAKALGIGVATLYRKIKEYQL